VDLDAGEAAVTDDTAAAEPVLNERQLLGELKGVSGRRRGRMGPPPDGGKRSGV